MRLELINFRSWKRREFEFPDEGLVLLSGASGSGKTSILSSIYFVLYGIGTKIISFGEKRCSVRFVYGGLDITRTKGPNRLLVSLQSGSETEEYEDEVAQAIITKKFGTNFTYTSYITQKTVQSFLNLGPTDKMNFLEQLSLGEEDISGIKKRSKEKIKEKKETLQQRVGQLELLTLEVGEMKPPVEITFPLGPKHSDIKIKNEGIYWKRTIKELEEKRSSQKKVEEEFSKEKVKKAIHEKQSTLFDECITKRDKLSRDIESIEFDGDDNIVDLKSTLSFLKNKREFAGISDRYNEERGRYDELYTQEMELLKKEESKLKEKVCSFDRGSFSPSRIKNIEEDISVKESLSSLTGEILTHERNRSQYAEYDREEKIKELESQMESLRSEISVTEQRVDIKCCPNCKVSLRFRETNLVLADGDPVDPTKSKIEIKRIKGEIAGCKTLIDSIRKEILLILYTDTKIKEYRDRKDALGKKSLGEETLSQLEDELRRLREGARDFKNASENLSVVSSKIKSEDSSHTLKALKLQVDKRKNELQTIKDRLEEDLETDYTEEELRTEISKQELSSQQKKSLIDRVKELTRSCDKLVLEIEKIKLSPDRDFEEEIGRIEESIGESIIKEKEHKRLDYEIKKYLQYKKEEEIYNKWRDKLQKCRDDEESAKKELAWCDIFMRKIQEAESISISQTIDNINHEMNYYLEKFFPDNPISVFISPYKETKKDIKSSINIVVGYKGVETDLGSLSGGEYDRVLLSLVLALNKMFGSDLIMLDESISSLDGEITGEIIEVLKEHLKEKVIIIVSHQIPTGLFDGVINID